MAPSYDSDAPPSAVQSRRDVVAASGRSAAGAGFATGVCLAEGTDGPLRFYGTFSHAAGKYIVKEANGNGMRTADSELLQLIGEGSEEAFVAFYERFKGPVFRFAFHMTGSIPLSEEITQEVFVIWIQKKCGYDKDRGSLPAYLYGIARNRARRHLRRRAMTMESADRAADPSHRFPQEEQVLRSEKRRLVREGVLALPEKYREVVALCDLQELTYEQAAQALGCRIGTVRSRLHRARELLGRKLMENGQSVNLLNAVRNTP